MFLAALNSDVVKFTLLAVTVPLWWPFLKALYTELNNALREEGGLLGSKPSEQELRRIDQAEGRYESPLVSQERKESQPRQASPGSGAGRTRSSSARGGSSGPARQAGATAKLGFSKPRGVRGFSRKENR